MLISVIIPSYNRVEVLEKCLTHILDQTLDKNQYEVIIVDDCSKDATNAFGVEAEKKFENVSYIRNQTNKGLASTRNVGVRIAKGDIFVFLDNDLLVSKDYLESHKKMYEKNIHPQYAVVSNITYHPKDLAKTNFGSHIQSRAIGYRRPQNNEIIDLNDLPSNYFAGGGSSCRKEDAYSIGLFEEGLKKYGSEDELFGFRLKKKGVKICFCDDAKIIHLDSNIFPQYWKIKYIELGRYSLKTLKEVEPELFYNSLYHYLDKVDYKKDNLKTKLIKRLITIFSSSIFRKPVEQYVFITDSYRIMYLDIVYRYITMAWIIQGFRSAKNIDKVEY